MQESWPERSSFPNLPGDSVAASVESQFANGNYFLLRLGLDEARNGNAAAEGELLSRMHVLQSKQEVARFEVTGHLTDGTTIHPDIYMATANWISKDGVSVFFGFDKDKSKHLKSIEFGKTFTYSRNQTVATRDLVPAFRLKG